MLEQLVNWNKAVDGDQSTEGSYKHAMRAPGQSYEDASNATWNFIMDNKNSGMRL